MRKPQERPDPPVTRRDRRPWKSPFAPAVAVGMVILFAAVPLLLFLPDFVADRFLKGRVIAGIAEAYPAHRIHIGGMRYSIWKNEIRCDSVALSTIDSSISCTLAGLSVSGISPMQFLLQGNPGPEEFHNSVVTARDIVVSFPQQQYEIRCGLLQLSAPDSEAVLEALTLNPPGDDEQFFAGSVVRKTRFRLLIPHAGVSGISFPALLRGKVYRARSARFDEAFLDVLVNNDKPRPDDSSSPPGPHELLAAVVGTLQVDSLTFVRGRMRYGERFAVGARAAQLMLDSLHLLVRGISNLGDPDATVAIRAEGRVMEEGWMTFLMTIPLAQEGFSFHLSGSVGRMNLCVLDSFLETAEQVRITSGVLQGATFEVHVASGRAGGNVRAEYTDFRLAAINGETGSETDFPDAVASFIANTFTIRGSNTPDGSGSLRAGTVKYERKRDESFLQFSWFALRSGIRDVVGI